MAKQQIAATSESQEETRGLVRRRNFAWACVFGFLGANLFMTLRFFFPRVLFEPKTSFKIGYPGDFSPGVDTRFQAKHRIWVVRNSEGLFVIFAKCTHLGCTPDWVESEQKFKCPCHGSGYDTEGVNFEGPAPRPMDRPHLALGPDGQIVVDVSLLYTCAPGHECGFEEEGAFLRV